MKLIFLDVDGVLNRDDTRVTAPSGCMFVEDELVKRLQTICDATHAKIVLSSTWRAGWYDIADGKTETANARDYAALADKLGEYGISIHGRTPRSSGGARVSEIFQYLRGERDVDGFVILDDMLLKSYATHQIPTDPETGLTDADVEKAIEMLMG